MTGSTISSGSLNERRRKALFRAWHRGTREMDLVMGRFADAHLHIMNDADLADFERLIDVPDPELLAWVTGEREAAAEHDTAVFRSLRDFNNRTAAAR